MSIDLNIIYNKHWELKSADIRLHCNSSSKLEDFCKSKVSHWAGRCCIVHIWVLLFILCIYYWCKVLVLVVLVGRMASGRGRFSLLLVQMFEMVRSSDKMIADLVAAAAQLSSAIGLIVTSPDALIWKSDSFQRTNKTRQWCEGLEEINSSMISSLTQTSVRSPVSTGVVPRILLPLPPLMQQFLWDFLSRLCGLNLTF